MQKKIKSKKRRSSKQRLSANDIKRIMSRMEKLAQDGTISKEIDIISLHDMAAYLEITPETLRKRAKNKEIKAYFAGNGRVYFLRPDFDKNLFAKDGILSCADIAKKMNMTTRTVLNWIKEGKLVAKKYGHKWLINYDDFLDFLELGLYQ